MHSSTTTWRSPSTTYGRRVSGVGNVDSRVGDSVIGRMYMVNVLDRERFYLRLLLLNVKGATSFEDLRRVGHTVHRSYQDAARARGQTLLQNDDEFRMALQEACDVAMPAQIRELVRPHDRVLRCCRCARIVE